MPADLSNVFSLAQARRAVADRAIEHFTIDDEIVHDHHRQVQRWDHDGDDTLIAVFQAAFDNGSETISLHIEFGRGSVELVDVHGLMVSNGGDIGTIAPNFLEHERVRHEQAVLRETLIHEHTNTLAPAIIDVRAKPRL